MRTVSETYLKNFYKSFQKNIAMKEKRKKKDNRKAFCVTAHTEKINTYYWALFYT